MNILVEDLERLRITVARLFGEDIAQDAMVRILSHEYREHWYNKELRVAKRQWQKHKRRSLRWESSDWQQMENLLCRDDTNRIHAVIELKRLCSLSLSGRGTWIFTVAKLIRTELGFDSMPRQREEQIRKMLREGKF